MKRGSLLSQPQAVLQKLASISDGNPLAPRSSRGFLFQILSPEKDGSSSDRPHRQVRDAGSRHHTYIYQPFWTGLLVVITVTITTVTHQL